MKIRLFSKVLSIISTVLLISCSKEFQDIEPPTPPNSKINDIITEFYQKVHPGSRSDSRLLKITNIDTQHFIFNDSNITRTENDSIELSYDIHTVSIDFGNSTGYAILSDTPGIDRLFYYTEEGCIGDTATITPLKDMILNIPATAEAILSDKNKDKDQNISKTRGDINIQPLVKFYWHQEFPFNYYATYCTCEKCRERGNHMLAGCVPVALAQTIATVKLFKGTFYGNRNIDFDSLPLTGDRYMSVNKVLALAHFFQEISLNCQVKYGCDGTQSDLFAATNYMRDLGYLVDLVEGGLDKERYIKYLQCGMPHIMRGLDRKEGGHAWILDGAIETSNSCLYHINWGYGEYRSNGWSTDCFYGDLWTPTGNEHLEFPEKTWHMYISAPSLSN